DDPGERAVQHREPRATDKRRHAGHDQSRRRDQAGKSIRPADHGNYRTTGGMKRTRTEPGDADGMGTRREDGLAQQQAGVHHRVIDPVRGSGLRGGMRSLSASLDYASTALSALLWLNSD